MKPWIASQVVSTPGVLSAKNSTQYMKPAAAITAGSCRISSSGGKTMLPEAPRIPRTAKVA